jgi:hypothetical protein
MGAAGTGAVWDFADPPKTAPGHDPYPNTRDHVTGHDAIVDRCRLFQLPRLLSSPPLTSRLPSYLERHHAGRADFESPVLA